MNQRLPLPIQTNCIMGKPSPSLRSILITAAFLAVLTVLFILNIVVTPLSFLQSERRAPARFPDLSFVSIKNESFADDFESFTADTFPFRDGFRTVRSAFMLGVLRYSDKDGLYTDASGIGKFASSDASSITKTALVIDKVASSLDDMNMNIYYSFIPDKSIYSDKRLPGFDAVMTARVLKGTAGMEKYTFIDLTDALDANSFYKTDFHWNQSRLDGVVSTLGESMRFGFYSEQYEQEFAGKFRGVYAGQLALPTKSDILTYLTLHSLTAQKLNSTTKEIEPTPVYDLDRLNGVDPYDVFLSGAQPLVILENDSADAEGELYIFRDSFTSSLAPLLAGAYARVTLIDLRYIDLRTLSRYVEFKPGSDVLFIYSSIILNNPEMLLVY